ncbi:aminotransferase class III-fold pyridoxal phosphate-dependent enzyme [Reichenbachiella sp. MALMAid0571]|uniref:aspartate aminotransferase family protein n=1 Tax=Reichenbachiella sp. MALMAid0571 TaxID=3143939 RepID=UPI0032DFD98E
MDLFNVYPVYPIEIDKAKGFKLWDKEGKEYTDLYGGHAVISIGHSHPHYIKRMKDQLDKLAFYSNSIEIPIQKELAKKLGEMSGYEDYNLFLCNSGAEANENALKVASFETKRSKILAFKGGFHGRTSGAVAITDNPKIIAPFNQMHEKVLVDLNDLEATEKVLQGNDIAAVIIEGIQGLAGIYLPTQEFMTALAQLCKKYGVMLILDEVQSGYGRAGEFFAHQLFGIRPDIITTAKGMGNGYPIGGVLISPKVEAWFGMLGTTFGGNHLACAAALAVLEVIEKEKLIENAKALEAIQLELFSKIPGVKEVRGKGLMTAIEFDFPVAPIRKKLVFEHGLFTGSSSNPNVLRFLPPLTITEKEVKLLANCLTSVLEKEAVANN